MAMTMEIRAGVANTPASHEAWVETAGSRRPLSIPGKTGQGGSAVNGGEMLALALATCYCNDAYREAAGAGLTLTRIEVEVRTTFGGRGEPARSIRYSVRASSPDDPGEVEALLRLTDQVAEIQNTLRLGLAVSLDEVVVEGG